MLGEKDMKDAPNKKKQMQRKCSYIWLSIALLFELAIVLCTYFVMRRNNERAIRTRKASVVRRIQKVIEFRYNSTALWDSSTCVVALHAALCYSVYYAHNTFHCCQDVHKQHQLTCNL